MKQMGSIPPWFLSDDGMLRIGGHSAEALVAQAGDTPLFVYDLARVRAKIDAFRLSIPSEVGLHYAIKANPYEPLLRFMASMVDGLDVASGGELQRALACGGTAAHISMAGPGKRDDELEAAIAAGATINLESEGEAARALRIADRLGLAPRLAVRVNPDFEIKGSGMRMGGGAKPFGVDAERVPALVRMLLGAGADWQGFHVFAGSQALDGEAIIAAQRSTIALSARLAEEAGAAPPLVNLGGGFGIPYFPGEQPLDLAPIGAALGEALAARGDVLRDSRFAIELGRWLVGDAGVYLTRIVDRKVSHGEIFVIVDGGLHHQLAASGNFGTVVRRNYPLALAHKLGAPAEEEVSVVGCLCTPLDRLGDRVGLPRSEVGDLVVIFMAGAYGASASPQAFLGHPPAREMTV